MRSALLWLLLTSVAFAQGQTQDPPSLEQMDLEALENASLEELLAIPISIGGGRESTALEATASVWVLDRDLVRETAALSPYEILRLVPGTVLFQYAPGQVRHNFRFPGSFPENQTAVLLNGSSILDEGLGVFEQQMLHLNDIERVEAVLGPASTLYGANAFSGVINFITRRPLRKGTRLWAQAEGGFGQGSRGRAGDPLGTGALGTGYVEGSTGWTSGGVKLSVGAASEPSFGFEGDLARPSGLTQPVQRLTSLAELEQDLPRGWLLAVQATAALKRGPFQLVDAADTRQQGYTGRVKLSRQGVLMPEDHLELELSLNHFSLDFGVESPTLSTVPLTLASTTSGLKVEYRPATFARNTATVGAEVRGALIDPTPSDMIEPWGRQQLGLGLFCEDTFRALPQLLLTAGARVDLRLHPGDSPLQYFSASPRASAVWLFREGHALRLEYSSGFRIPTGIERAANVYTADGQPLVVGKRDLESERLYAFQLGYEGRFGMFVPRAEIYVGRTFRNITPDLVPFGGERSEDVQGRPIANLPGGEPWSSKAPYYYKNLDAYWIPGATARLELNPRPGARTFLLYTWVPLGAQHWLSLNQYLTFGAASFSANLRFQDAHSENLPWSSPGHVALNVRAGYALDAAGHWSLALSALNLLDFRFRRPTAGDLPPLERDGSNGELVGRRVFLTLGYRTE